jgi:hypothetical protein
MYKLQYSKLTNPEISVRCIHYGLIFIGCRSQVLDDGHTDMPLLESAEKCRPRFLPHRNTTNVSAKCARGSSMAKRRKHWIHHWIKRMCIHRLSLERMLASVGFRSRLPSVMIQSFYHIFCGWWVRSHCPGPSEGFYGTVRMILVTYPKLFLRILKLPQFHMGVDPITKSATVWQGSHLSNHGGK